MNIKKLFVIFAVFAFFATVSCYNDAPGDNLPLLAGITSSDDATDTTPAAEPEPTVPDPGGDPGQPSGDDNGNQNEPGKVASLEDVKTILNGLLGDIDIGALMPSLNDACVEGTVVLINEDTISVTKQVSCDPFGLLLTISMNGHSVEGFDCAVSGVIRMNVQFPSDSMGACLITINTPAGAPITTTGEACGDNTIELSGLSMMVTLNPFGTQFSGTVLINGVEQVVQEFLTPADILALLKDAFDNIPWDDLLGMLQGGSMQSAAPSSGLSGLAVAAPLAATSSSMYTVYNEDGLKVDAGISLDFSNPGIIIDLTFTGYRVYPESFSTLNGTLTMFATLDSWRVVKLVCDTEAGAPLWISGIPLITPRIGLEGVTLYYDYIDEQILDTGEYAGTISLNGIGFDFDPGWINTILAMLD
ncbi:MAG: hypothetical protein JXA07_08155 [Spirochaetes bacterium]|nr:hypothetical protein [Spirochaetota bacterium]